MSVRFDKDANRIQSAATSQRLPVKGGGVWFFAHHPTAWEVASVDGVDRWLPVLRKIPFKRGVNGVTNKGEIGPFMTALQARGWNVLRLNPNPGHILNYAGSYPAIGGSVLIDNWTEVYQISPRKCKIRFEDQAGYDKWRAELVDSGIIGAPQDIVIEDIVDDFEQQKVRRLMGKEQKPIVVEKLEANRAQLNRMRAAVLVPETDAPKKRGRRNG